MFYNNLSINQVRDKVKDIKKLLKGKRFDGFVGRGVSGITMASMLAYAMKKKLVVVRKDKTNSHSFVNIEGFEHDEKLKLIVVDDFICTGNTIETIVNQFKNCGDAQNITLLGLILYSNDETVSKKKLHGLKLIGTL